jgi:outer membrane receptor for ferrienterochelin and colicins
MAVIAPGQDGAAYGHPGQTVTLFTTARSAVTVAGADITMTYKLSPATEVTLAAERFSYQFSEPGTLAFARPENRAYLRADYANGAWTAMARATWTGAMDLARFYDYANTPRYNLDGSRKQDKSPAYWTLDVRGEYGLNRNLSLFVGVDNLTDFKQSDKESMLWVNSAGSYDVTHIWGPSRGRFVYGGLKWAL